MQTFDTEYSLMLNSRAHSRDLRHEAEHSHTESEVAPKQHSTWGLMVGYFSRPATSPRYGAVRATQEIFIRQV
jgi:hypothetical protein